MFTFIAFLFSATWISEHKTEFFLIVAAIIFLIIFFIVRRHKRIKAYRAAMAAANNRQEPAPASSPENTVDDSGSITFRVAGVTFDNDDGTNRQDILRDLKDSDDKNNLDIELEESEYDNDLAIAVFANGNQIGFVPKSKIYSVQNAQKHTATCYVSEARIIGGGTNDEGERLSYGCEITLEY